MLEVTKGVEMSETYCNICEDKKMRCPECGEWSCPACDFGLYYEHIYPFPEIRYAKVMCDTCFEWWEDDLRVAGIVGTL